MTTVRDGNSYLPGGPQPTNLGTPAIREQIWSLSRPGQTVVEDTVIDGRTVRLSITSVRLQDRPGEGLLVAANEIGRQRDEVVRSMWTYALAALATLAVAGWMGYVITGGLLRPIRRLREATENTTFEDLTKRVEVTAPTDDVAQLAMNFNHMLERLETGFANQRRFVHDAGHELRTPMTVIRGYLELLRAEDPEDVDQTRILLLDELDRMQVLVEELLILARSGRPDFVSPAWIEADIFLESVLSRIRVFAPRNWELDARPGGLIRADRHRLMQALEQLAVNAVRHTSEEDRISVGAAWTKNDDGGTALGGRPRLSTDLEIWVSDTGSGIPAEDQERIFERFFKGRNAAGSSEGSGLGLSIVKAIAEAHGGTVRVESAVGEGSRFVLTIPSGGDAEEEAAGGAKRAGHPAGKPKVTRPSSGMAILPSPGGSP
jgi:signal transduction histidine kinase